jgi:hypothetical protein
MVRPAFAALWLTLVMPSSALVAGCRCSRSSGEVDDLTFARCAQAAPPKERRVRSGQLELEVRERVLNVRSAAGLRVAAFTGPVGGTLSRGDFALLAEARPGFILFLGGLGDDVASASANLAGLAALRVPMLFVAGGSDRLPVIEEAFGSLADDAAELLLHGSGLREVRFGNERFAVISGSPLGRYALDDTACGFGLDDLNDVREALDDAKAKKQRISLLSWGAPSGWGLSHAAGVDVGSPELFALGQALSAQGGVFAYPEVRAGEAVRGAARKGVSAVVPRLGRVGSTRGDGGRLPSSLMLLVLTVDGLVPAA